MIANNPVLTLALAFAFFVVALFVFFATIYVFRLNRTPVDSRDPLEQFVDWMNENGVEFLCHRARLQNGIEIYIYNLPGDEEKDIVFEFDRISGQLIQYGLDDTVYNELDN